MRNANKELNMEELEQVSAGFHRFLLPIVTTSHLPPAMDGAFFLPCNSRGGVDFARMARLTFDSEHEIMARLR